MDLCLTQHGIYELTFDIGEVVNDPFDVSVTVEFSHMNEQRRILGFYDGGTIFKVRFCPEQAGTWNYRVSSSHPRIHGIEGKFHCSECHADAGGPVRVSDKNGFILHNGERFLPIGTTCYAWAHQDSVTRQHTLNTLRQSPFNKVRMCVFPKWYPFSKDEHRYTDEPRYYPFERRSDGTWDFSRLNVDFFRRFEECVEQLLRISIQADIILFHPYDKWGFSSMSVEEDERYLRYVVARLGAYRNVWWSLANEWDFIAEKSEQHWDRLGEYLRDIDGHQRLISIHNGHKLFDYSRSWITHVSVQRRDLYLTTEEVDGLIDRYGKPVMYDEMGYEGNIPYAWGNLPPQEFVRRFWECYVRGGFGSHGETYLGVDRLLWWCHGGNLRGESVSRIQFLKQVLGELGPLRKIRLSWDDVCGGKEGEYYLFYFGNSQPLFRDIYVGEVNEYRVKIIDTWNMEIYEQDYLIKGDGRVNLPGRPYMAVLLIRRDL
ncbi:DUF5605 domain-containing protein [Alicyclobacillus vulcanalis]|uniref:DUF5060 domain-containing protein n=1 Tax=Alicyclobacillus vulcanalis TaxID=252246 RepID=A0A1N7PG99_9BACL|nr:DUF5605 domain-containing protein [Alicyclobacillus vulcanalis]SIT09634.1 Protein of unknown function [Alicyclobacillus vulcanalis]